MHFLLILTLSLSSWAATIEVPKEILDPGSIKLMGTPGANQKDAFEICNIKREKDGRPSKGGKSRCSTHKLGDDIHVPNGLYYVRYESTAVFVDVKDQQVPLQLSPLELTKVDGTFSFSIYRDFENSEDQRNLLMLESFVGFQSVWPDDNYCTNDTKMDNVGKEFCAKIKAIKAPSDLAWFWKFLPDGGVNVKDVYRTDKETTVVDKDGDRITYSVYSAKFKEDSGQWFRVGTGKDGDFISVFPGVYTAYFWSAGLHSSRQPNIVVK